MFVSLLGSLKMFRVAGETYDGKLICEVVHDSKVEIVIIQKEFVEIVK